MPREISVTLTDDELAAARTLSRVIYDGNRVRWGRRPPRSDDLALAGALAFTIHLARRTAITFSGPLPYCGPGRRRDGSHQPENVALWVKGEPHKVSIRNVVPSNPVLTFPAWRFETQVLPDFTVAAVIAGATVTFAGALSKQQLLATAAPLPVLTPTRRGLSHYKVVPLSAFDPAVLRKLLRDADTYS